MWKVFTEIPSRPEAKHVFRCLFKKHSKHASHAFMLIVFTEFGQHGSIVN
jgi:hypothetical protein